MGIPGAQSRITQTVLSWEGTAVYPHRYGGVEYRLGRRELGHIHGDHLVDIPFPTRIRDEIVASGQARPHHIQPDSGWVSCFLRHPEDVDGAIHLLQRSYDLAREQQRRRASAEVWDTADDIIERPRPGWSASVSASSPDYPTE